MKQNFIGAAVVALTLAFGGIGDSQVKSQFPNFGKQEAIDIEFGNCGDVIMSITGYGENKNIRYYVYEVSDTVFAIVEFAPKSDQASAIYILEPSKTILKFVPSEFNKLPGPCKTIEVLNLKNERNKF